MSAIFEEILFRLVRSSDLREDVLRMPFPKMGAEPALSVLNVQHLNPSCLTGYWNSAELSREIHAN